MDALPQSSRPLTMAFLRPENAEYAKTPRSTKTLNAPPPKTTTIRRALGDISNRKAAAPAAAAANQAPFSDKVKKAVSTASTTTTTVKPSLVLQSTLLRVAAVVPLSPSVKTTAKVSFHADIVAAPLMTTASKLVVGGENENAIDDDDEATIEQPAGRLWSQQESYDWDPDDDAQHSLNVSLEGAATFRDEWKEALDALHAERVEEYRALFQPNNDNEQQERWDRLQMDDDNALQKQQQQQQQLGFALDNNQGNDDESMWLGSRTFCARARCVAHLLLFHLGRLGFHRLAGVERRERRQFVAGNDPGHQCSAPPGILTRARSRRSCRHRRPFLYSMLYLCHY
jgi:hypothetical protein